MIKKIKAYPFAASLKAASATLNGQIVKLVPVGCMVEVAGTNLQPGDVVEINFETPVQHGNVTASCVVVKVYNQLTGGSLASTESQGAPKPGGPTAVALLELHFKSMSPEGQSAVRRFLAVVGGK